MDHEQMKRCLEVVAAYRASGLKGKAWVVGGDQWRARTGSGELVRAFPTLAGAA